MIELQTPESIHLNSQLKFMQNELLIKNEQIDYLKTALAQLENEKSVIQKHLEESRHEAQYLSSRYKAEIKLIKKQHEKELEIAQEKFKKFLEKDLKMQQQKQSVVTRQLQEKLAKTKLKNTDYKAKCQELEKMLKATTSELQRKQEKITELQRDLQKTQSDNKTKRSQLGKSHKLQEEWSRKVERQHILTIELRERLEDCQKKLAQKEQQYMTLHNRLTDIDNNKAILVSQQIESHNMEELRKQHLKITQFYQREIENLRDQATRSRITSSISEGLAPQLDQMLLIIKNCMSYEMPYIQLLDADKEFRKMPVMYEIFTGLKSILEGYRNAKERLEQQAQLIIRKEQQITQLELSCLEVNQKLKVVERKHHQSYEQTRKELKKYSTQAEEQQLKLAREIAERDSQIEEIKNKHQQLSRQLEEAKQDTNLKRLKDDPEGLLAVNEENAMLRLRAFETVNIIQIMAGLTVGYALLADRQELKLAYYRRYEEYFWKIEGQYILESRRWNSTLNRTKSYKKLRNVFISVVFIKICQVRLRKRKPVASSDSVTFSSIYKQLPNKRLCHLLTSRVCFGRAILNEPLEILRCDRYESRNQFDWTVEILKQEMINMKALEQQKNDRSAYPSQLFGRLVKERAQRRSKPDKKEDDMASSKISGSLYRRSQITEINFLKRQLDQAMDLAGSQYVSPRSKIGSPRLCGSIKSLRPAM